MRKCEHRYTNFVSKRVNQNICPKIENYWTKNLLVLALMIQTPEETFILLNATLDANALVTLLIYTRQTQQSAQSFRPCVSGEFDI